MTTVTSDVLRVLRGSAGPVTADEIAEALGAPRPNVVASLRAAAADGHVSLTFVDGSLAGRVAA